MILINLIRVIINQKISETTLMKLKEVLIHIVEKRLISILN